MRIFFVCCILLAVSIPPVVGDDAPVRSPAAPARLALYVRPGPTELTRTPHATSLVVVEVINDLDATIRFDTTAPADAWPWWEAADEAEQPTAQERRLNKGWQLVVRCQMPRETAHKIKYHSGPLVAKEIEVRPGNSVLVKVNVPHVYLAVGTCKVQAILKHDGERVAASEVATVECVEAAK